jgi:ABC-2 type transport system ATP-binding protein
MTPAFALRGIEKHYPGFRLGPLDLTAEPGTVLARIGPNDAGKTTLMDLLAGLLQPSRGELEIAGQKVRPGENCWREAIGYASEQQSWYENWSAEENLRFVARFFPRWSKQIQQELAARFELPLGKKVSTLSKGNRSKLALVAAFARRPRLLLLDEPTSGLDALVRADLLDTLRELLEDGEHTVFYSTHILSDVSRLADHLAFIRNGRLLQHSTRDQLEQDWRQLTFRLPVTPLPEAVAQLLLDHRVEDARQQAISRDFQQTSDQLRALGATGIEANRLGLDEIAVRILRSGTLPQDEIRLAGPGRDMAPAAG